MSNLSLSIIVFMFGCLAVVPQESFGADRIEDPSSIPPNRVDCIGALSSRTYATSSGKPVQVSQRAHQIIQEIREAEAKVGVRKEDRSDFLLQRGPQSGYVRTPYTYIIYHGPLKSPAYTRWLAEAAFRDGHNVINIRLPKHARKIISELNGLKRKDFIDQVAQINELAELLGNRLVHVGHSAGALSASLGAMTSPYTSGLVIYGGAFWLTRSSFNRARALGYTGLTNFAINALASLSGDTRYVSAAAGRATVRFAKYLRNLQGNRDYAAFIDYMNSLGGDRILWLDTAIDKTVEISVNQNIAALVPNIGYDVLPAEAGVAHVNVADDPEQIQGPGQQMLRDFAEEVLALAR